MSMGWFFIPGYIAFRLSVTIALRRLLGVDMIDNASNRCNAGMIKSGMVPTWLVEFRGNAFIRNQMVLRSCVDN